uniref:Uncharacterized protein n=1 Tax=viral metagenome TaxID=1070528 RepID=A0A6C0JI52_9ZZZZ
MAQLINKASLNTGFNSLGTSFYPVGMGLGVNLRNQGGYKTWKGDGINSNPTGIAHGHIRPLTNLDPGNVFPAPFGKARPLKHYRKGRVIPNVTIITLEKEKEGQFIYKDKTYVPEAEIGLIQYNLNRSVKSSKGTSLGGGFGGSGLLNEMQDKPGSYLVKQNPVTEVDETTQLREDCTTCQGVGIIDTYYPNKYYLTENPEANTENKILCCNQEKFALKRVIYANTNLPKNYYTTHKQYLQNRCKTFNQKSFNFETYNPINAAEIAAAQNPGLTAALIKASKPGDPLSITNTYFANCQPNAEIVTASEINLVYAILDILLKQNSISKEQYDSFISNNDFKFTVLFKYLQNLPKETRDEALAIFIAFINNPYYGVPLSGPNNPVGCKLTVYKPNNPQYAQQGAVDASTRILKLNVTTIEKNAASYYTNPAGKYIRKTDTSNLVFTNVPFLYKNKPAQSCERPPLNFSPTTFQNKKECRYVRKPDYFTPVSQASPYRYYYYQNPVFSRLTNHYKQSPNGNALL